ncbi:MULTISPECIES: methanethiol S-methyltransferase [unclassified Pseudoxanthomonas]|uniref:methanethiol S-methyltransferase n=1 Tax=unclassified Pseudoxanthomonas TaxID=2645906 RepID=UPI0030770607
MSRVFALLYGAACYTVFLAAFLYAIPFVAGFGVPKHIDNGVAVSLPLALGINLTLLTLFALQHSIMARPAFKRWWTRFVPAVVERSTFVLATSLVLALLFWQWRPLPQLIWDVEGEAARWILFGLSAVGWLLVLASTFLINHFDLFGLRQVWRHARGQGPAPEAPFVVRALYRIVRHPIMLGFLIAFWATPTMSLGHLLFAAVTTGYILVAVKFLEERDLVARYGETYRAYQRQVPMLLPWRKPKDEASGPAVSSATFRPGSPAP